MDVGQWVTITLWVAFFLSILIGIFLPDEWDGFGVRVFVFIASFLRICFLSGCLFLIVTAISFAMDYWEAK